MNTIYPTIIAPLDYAEAQGHNLLGKYLSEKGLGRKGYSGALHQRILGKLLRRLSPRYRNLGPNDAFHLFQSNAFVRKGSFGHFLWGDDYIVRVITPKNSLFTLHQPWEKWSEETWRKISHCCGIITMAEREAILIRSRCPHVPVAFIPHGVDLDFWRPRNEQPVPYAIKTVAVVGRYMRNFQMLVRVAKALIAQRNDVKFRWLVNPDFEVPKELVQDLPPNRFELVRNLSAKELLEFYQSAHLFFTPYDLVTASNAIVEASASGCPIITTHVAGMPSYCSDGGGVMVDNNDDSAALFEITRVLDDSDHRSTLARLTRRKAETCFGWPKVVSLHLEFYASLKSAPNS